jgi:repressor LexA
MFSKFLEHSENTPKMGHMQLFLLLIFGKLLLSIALLHEDWRIMGALENSLKKLIIDRYGSMRNFANAAGLPPSTVYNALDRGIANTRTETSYYILDMLDVSKDSISLSGGKKPAINHRNTQPEPVAKHAVGLEMSPVIPVCKAIEELDSPIDKASAEFIAPKNFIEKYPSSVYILVPDDRINRKIPRGYIAMVDLDDVDEKPGKIHCAYVDGSMVFGRYSVLTGGFELLPESYDVTARPVIVDHSVNDARIIGVVVRATMPDWFEV